MARLRVVHESVRGVVPPAPNVSTYQADPEISVGTADGAFVEIGLASVIKGLLMALLCGPVLSKAADRTAGAAPFQETGAVENMLAGNG